MEPIGGTAQPRSGRQCSQPDHTRTPLIAITAVHALCNRMKNKLVALTSQLAF
jgi:hypothetical protein